METVPEQVLQEVAPPPARTEIEQLVADMQPLAQAATMDIAWLSQLGPFDAQQAVALAASAGDALARIRANTSALQKDVIVPFIQFWTERLSQTTVREIGQFGSRSYDLALVTSDFDIVCILQPGTSRKEHFDTVLRHISADPGPWTRTQKQVFGDTAQCKWMGVWVDFKAAHGGRHKDLACLSTDLMKVVVKRHEQSQVDAVHAFKLLCHDLNIIQHHMQAKAQKFKSIALCFFAFAALDAWVLASGAGLVADSATGLYIMVLARAFLAIDWTHCSIEIALDGSTRVVRRRPEQRDDINIWLESGQVNAAANVTHDFVATCRTALSNVTSQLPQALSDALQGQCVPTARELQEADHDHDYDDDHDHPPTARELQQRPSPAAPPPPPLEPPPPLALQPPPPAPTPTASPVVAVSAAASPPLPKFVTVSAAASPALPEFGAAPTPAPALPLPPLTKENLAEGAFAIYGGGESCRVIIWDSPQATDNSPVVAYFPGSDGWHSRSQPGDSQPGDWDPPVPCRSFLFDIGGKGLGQGKGASSFKRKLPEVALVGLHILRQWADSARRKVVLFGWSRGASWALRVAVLEAKLLDGIWAFAAYPTAYDPYVQDPPLVIVYGTPGRF